MKQHITTQNTNNQNIDVIATKLDYIQADIADIKKKLEEDTASKEWVNSEYGQTKKIVNAILVIFGTSIVLAFAAFVINGGLNK
jgi:tetrahydromethanopterin S-methyltransferase subunit G